MIRTVVLTIYLQMSSIHSVQVTPFMQLQAQAIVFGPEECLHVGIDIVHSLALDGMHAEASCRMQKAKQQFTDEVFGLERGWLSLKDHDQRYGRPAEDVRLSVGPTLARLRKVDGAKRRMQQPPEIFRRLKF